MLLPYHTYEYISKSFSYDPNTGYIHRITRLGKPTHPTPVGSLLTNGHLGIRVDGKLYKNHRLAWLLHYKVWPVGMIDHVNRNPADNRISNLRETTASTNQLNRNYSDKAVGCYWHQPSQRWQVKVARSGKLHCVGYEADLLAARALYLRKRRLMDDIG